MKIPVKAAKELAEKYKAKQVILFAWDGKLTHVVTYGETVEDCAQAANGANNIKKSWGWPEDTLTEPARVKGLQNRVANLEQDNEALQMEVLRLKRALSKEEQ